MKLSFQSVRNKARAWDGESILSKVGLSRESGFWFLYCSSLGVLRLGYAGLNFDTMFKPLLASRRTLWLLVAWSLGPCRLLWHEAGVDVAGAVLSALPRQTRGVDVE